MSGQAHERAARPGLASLRDPELRPDWSLAVVVLAVLALALAIATGLGDPARVLYTVFPALLSIAVGLAAGPRAGAVVAVVVAALVTLATLASATPLTAALAFAAVLLWLTVPSRFAPSASIAPLLQLAYFIVAAFGTPGMPVLEAAVFALAGAVGGSLVVLAIAGARRLVRGAGEVAADEPAVEPAAAVPEAPAPPPITAARLLGPALAAAVSAGLLYWRVTTDSQTAAWVLLTFILVFQPTHLATTIRSLGRVAGTLAGFALVMGLSVLPGDLATTLGVAAIVPSIAYAKRDYVVSVAATTVVVVTFYGAPTGEYLAWGLARSVDTAIGAAVAIVLSAVVRRLEA